MSHSLMKNLVASVFYFKFQSVEWIPFQQHNSKKKSMIENSGKDAKCDEQR